MVTILNLEEIKNLLLNSEVSIYSIAKEIDVKRSTLNVYRNGKGSFENMSIKLAQKLQQYINDKINNS